jgi:tRNA modification GTPase
MNSLLGKERSIVTEIPGTTRDTIEENLIIDGIPIILVDTAGIRDADCKVEIEGVRRAMSSLNMAEIVIFVVDASEPITTDEIGLIERIGSRRCIVVMNKIDLGIHDLDCLKNDFVAVKVSLIRGDGVEDIRRELGAKLMAVTTGEHRATISERHKRVLLEVDASVEECEHLADGGREETVALIATTIQSALGSLGSLNGRSYSSELLKSVFSKFCIGK